MSSMSLFCVLRITYHCLVSGNEVAICEALLSQWPSASGKVRSTLIAALSALLALSSPATQTALDAGLISSLVSNLQQTHLTLTVQTSSTDKLKKVRFSFWPSSMLIFNIVSLKSLDLVHT